MTENHVAGGVFRRSARIMLTGNKVADTRNDQFALGQGVQTGTIPGVSLVKVAYCNNCTARIASEAIATGAIESRDDGKIYCPKCAPLFKVDTGALQAVQPPGVPAIDQSTVVGLPAMMESTPAVGVTKFYFCETCGKRITDKQILEGLGRDKKLKGVYCKGCAVGVMTLEMDAINIEHLGKAPPKNHSTPSSNRSAASPTPRKGSGIIRPPDLPVKHFHSSTARGDKQNGFPTIFVFGGVALVAIVGALALLHRPERATPLAEPNATSSHVPPKPIDATVTSPPPPVIPDLRPKTFDSGSINTATTSEPAKVEISLPTEKTETVTAVDPVTPIVAAPSAVIVDDRPAPTAAKNEVAGKSRELPAGILKELTFLLRQNQFSEAEKLLDEKIGDESLAGTVDQLKKEKSDLLEIKGLRQRALETLRAKNGTTVTLKLRGTKTSGVIKTDPLRSDLALVLKDGLEMPIKPELLDAFDVESLVPAETVQAEEFRRRGLLFLAAGEWAKAENYFSKARDMGLQDATAIYFDRIAAVKTDAKETAAAESWKKAETLFSNRNWTGAKQAYEAIKHDNAESQVFAANKETLKARLQSIDEALGPSRTVSLELGDGIKLELLLISPGEFEMGSKDMANEKPIHKVKISRPFYMGKYVVTQPQYQKIMGKNPSRIKGDTLPVDMITFVEAQEFCKKVSSLTGKTVRLPTEAEWEYACRAGTKTKYSAGDNESLLDLEGWYNKNSEGKMHPVGQKKPNAWGLYDMHGNIWQFCQDWSGTYSAEAVTDPKGPTQGTERVLRGGSWNRYATQCQSSSRGNREIHGRDDAGLRVVVEFP